ncbi:hypothetical protein [Kordia sp.]|uniref:hypothetical protein n=1 Tax=Kordia sp. TaxID=1965332 RepID=UPI003B5AB631
MKKKNLKNLSVKKLTISNLTGEAQKGGTIRTFYKYCGTGPETIFTCPQTNGGLACTYNSQNRCETIEVDGNTLPIC